MTDEEVAVIEAALAVDRLFWPPHGMDAFSIGEVHQVVQTLHDAALKLLSARQQGVGNG